jgi:squalene-hopene/tetraprenyl-beta-curcumene cyclase
LKLQPAVLYLGHCGRCWHCARQDSPIILFNYRQWRSKEIHAGDWKIKNPRTESGCWAFEFNNDLYPDIDDTALAVRALLSIKLNEGEEQQKISSAWRGLHWIKDMQSRDGGWAAFDRDNDKQIVNALRRPP